MFFFLSKVIPAFFYPLSLGIIMIWLVWFRSKKGFLKKVSGLTFAFLTLFSTAPATMLLVLPLESRYLPNQKEPDKNYETVIVAGGFARPVRIGTETGIEFSDSSDRILEALRLYKKGIVSNILITGGSGLLLGGEIPESVLARSWLSEMGVDPDRVIIEDQSRNTAENAAYTAKILKPGQKSLLITSAFHMPRTLGCFRKAKIDVDPWPVDFMYHGRPFHFPEDFFLSPLHLLNARIALKEYLGLVAYWLKGYI